MPSFISAATALATLAFSAVSVSAFDAAASDSLAVYWGQGNAQKSLGSFCYDDTIDIIPIGFVDVFPDEDGSNGYPGTNFGNACGGVYTTSGGQTTQLLGPCPDIEADIKACQANGKKILLSLGGGDATGASLASDTTAVAFADFLWGAFGPVTEEWTTANKPRPFGDAVIDGFDFDIESLAADIPTTTDAGYAAMANEFRRLFALCLDSTFYLSAAPQCIIPDGHLANAISNAAFDFLFVQFYNTPQCSARSHFDNSYGQAANGGVPTDISYDAWITWVLENSANKATKVYIGLPGAPGAAGDNGNFYLSPTEAGQLITDFKCKYPANFGGVMLWEATYSENNQINGRSYAQNIKALLTGCSCLGSTTSSSVTSSTTSTTSNTTSYTPPILSATPSSPFSTYSSPTSSPLGPVSTSTSTSSTTPSSSSSITSSSSSPSNCGWGSACSTDSSSTPANGASTSSSSTYSTPTGWPTFGTCTFSTCMGLATGSTADPTGTSSNSATSFTEGSGWSADPSSYTSTGLTSTWTITAWSSWTTDPSTSTYTTTASVISLTTLTLVPVPSSDWYASTYSNPASSSVILPTSLASTASPAPTFSVSSFVAQPPAWSSSTAKSSSPSANAVRPVTSAVTTKPSSAAPVLPQMSMMTVSVAQGATWSSDPSLTLSTGTGAATNAAPVATFTGAAARRHVMGGGMKGAYVALGVVGLAGALVL